MQLESYNHLLSVGVYDISTSRDIDKGNIWLTLPLQWFVYSRDVEDALRDNERSFNICFTKNYNTYTMLKTYGLNYKMKYIYKEVSKRLKSCDTTVLNKYDTYFTYIKKYIDVALENIVDESSKVVLDIDNEVFMKYYLVTYRHTLNILSTYDTTVNPMSLLHEHEYLGSNSSNVILNSGIF